MQVVGPNVSAAAGVANSHKPASAQKSVPIVADAPAAGASSTEPVDIVTLSPTAQELSAHGNSANSPAHRARALLADRPDLADMPFGKIVSGLIHGTLPDAPANDATDAGTVGDPPAVVDDPAAAPVGGDPAPVADGGATTDGADAAAPAGDDTPAVPTVEDILPPAETTDTTELVPPVTDGIDTAQLIEDVLDQSTTETAAA